MKPQEILFSVGFNKKEAQVYLAALELGGATITDIAQKANMEIPEVLISSELEKMFGELKTFIFRHAKGLQRNNSCG